jgi:O-antigen/teichoic acid export membrane protein
MKLPGLNRHDVSVRFAAGLAGNAIRGGLNLLAGILVARWLGPVQFGDLNFLLVSFTAVNQLLDLGTSTAFSTFVAQRRRTARFYLYYGAWVAAQFTLTLLCIAALPAPWARRIWVGHDRGIVLLAFGASFALDRLWFLAAAVGESVRESVIVQARNVGVAAFYLLGTAALAAAGLLTIRTTLWLTVAVYAAFSASLFAYLRARVVAPRDDAERLVEIWRPFASYTMPLVATVCCSFVYTFFDTWMLQRFGGSAQQGFYAAAAKLTSVSLLVTTSAIPVFLKEVAEAFAHGDTDRVRVLYSRTTQYLYFVAAVISCFAVPYAREILVGLIGYRFESGWTALGVMLLYPVSQSLGQVNGAFFYATGQTPLYRNLTIGSMALSMVLTYVLLAPPGRPTGGLGLGAVGLAVKTVLLSLVATNVQSLFIRRLYRLPAAYWAQATSVALLLAMAFSVRVAIVTLSSTVGVVPSVWVHLSFGLVLYGAGVAAAITFVPESMGLTRTDLTSLRAQFRAALLH